MHCKYSQKKPAMHKKTSRDKIAAHSLNFISKMKLFDAKTERSGIQDRFATHKSQNSSSDQPLVSI